LLIVGGTIALALVARATPVDFDLPAQTADQALLAFSQQAKVEVLYSFDELQAVPTPALQGRFEPEEALARLLSNTGFAARRSRPGKFVVARTTRPTGAVHGRLVTSEGHPARGVTVVLADTTLRTSTDEEGAFTFPAVKPGTFRLLAGGTRYRVAEQKDVKVEAGLTRELPPITMRAAGEVTELEPYRVTDRDTRLLIGEDVGAAPRRAAGNLDLPRTENNALPFTIFTREQIARSGVVQLNEFFQRELIDSSSAMPPEQDGATASFVSGSSNLGLRGYGSDETVVLVNGRRLPETFTETIGALGAPDVNLIPMALVQQIEVLPVSAGALYNGNAVGGVINIVRRPDFKGTEVRTTYTNALGGFDAPQASASLQWGDDFLDGKLHVLLNATFTRSEPAVESELNYQAARLAQTTGLAARATPNIVSASGEGLFGPGTPNHTSVAPGANGSGGLAAFDGRHGVYSLERFDTPGGLSSQFNSLDYVYGREQKRSAYYGAFVYDFKPWLQFGLDVTYARTIVHRGYELYPAVLTLNEASPFNPFGQTVQVALHETTPRFSQDYNEADLVSYSAVGGVLAKLPHNWLLSADGQYSRSIANYRGLVGVNRDRWQELVDTGRYNPLRDTQVFGPPDDFYDRVLVYYGGPDRFVSLGDYETFEGAARVTNEALPLPTGKGTLNAGADYRMTSLAPYLQEPRYADGTPAAEIIRWTGRTLERISVFGELQAPLLPAARLPDPVMAVELDVAGRYTISDQANEETFSPTIGLKVDLAGGVSFRGSYTTSDRFPTPMMSRPLSSGSGGGSTPDPVVITDPLRNERYETESRVAVNPNVRPESAVTQSAGVMWLHGKTHRFRVSLDFADTTKVNEFIALGPQQVVTLESSYPDRVIRATPPPVGTPASPPRITTVLVGPANAAQRHSQNWSLAGEYAWRDFAGGTLDLRGRWVHFQRYDRQLLPGGPWVDELGAPASTVAPVRDRVTFSAGWNQPRVGFGVDTHYLGSRRLPPVDATVQGGNRIDAYWQIDAYARTDLSRWLPRQPDRVRLTAQLRINNLSDFSFPKYLANTNGAGVQPYGDWRGRTISVSLTAEY
jgi:outer membrane receptor protein involved in Fe transport